MSSPAERNPVFDLVKAAMMLWVVWGHLGLYKIVAPETSVYMLNAKIGVNMPVFFVIGGYLAASTFKNADWCKLLSRSIHFLWPQLVMAVVYSIVMMPFGEKAFGWVLNAWFLHTYAIIYIMAAGVFRMADTDGRRWCGFFALYMAMIFWPSCIHLGWFGQVTHMFPYFCFGLMCLGRSPLRIDWKIGCLCGAAYLAFVFLQGDSEVNGMNFWKVNVHWKTLFFDKMECATFFARTTVGITGSVFLLFLAKLAAEALPFVARLSSLGTSSLGVYVVHEYPMYVLGRYLPDVPFPACSRWLVALGVFIACHCLVCLLKRCRITRLVFFGDEASLTSLLRRVPSHAKQHDAMNGHR